VHRSQLADTLGNALICLHRRSNRVRRCRVGLGENESDELLVGEWRLS
jgi:hypothetical protein